MAGPLRAVTTRVLRDPVPLSWARGPVQIDGDDLVLPYHDAPYTITSAIRGTVWRDLCRVRTSEQAVSFAQQYGLLRVQPMFAGQVAREPVAHMLRVADDIRWCVQMLARLRKVVADGEPNDWRQLRHLLPETFDGLAQHRCPPAARRRPLVLDNLSQIIARRIDRRLRECRVEYRLDSRRPGQYDYVVLPANLEGCVYGAIAELAVRAIPIRICGNPRCEQPFEQGRRDQEYCSPRCGTYLRVAKLRKSRRQHHDKTKRKR